MTDASQPGPASSAVGGSDPNTVAIARAGVDAAHAAWLGSVAEAVPARLDAVVPQWRGSEQPVVVLAAVFGLALGALGRSYPHARGVLSAVAEAHPCWESLPRGRRLETLETLASDPVLVLDWLGETIPGLEREQAAGLVA